MDIRTPIKTNYGDWIEKFGELWKTQTEALQKKFGSSIEEIRMPGQFPTDVPILFVKKDALIDVLKFLKTEPGFDYNFLADLTATDEMPREPRFDLVFNLFSTLKHNRIRIKVKLADGEDAPTAIPLWDGANWAEREVFDMFGIKFKGHPDLRRILMDERYVGHPLRKDFPMRGYQTFTEPEIANPENFV